MHGVDNAVTSWALRGVERRQRGGAGGGSDGVAPALEGFSASAVRRDALILAEPGLARLVEAAVHPVHHVVGHEQHAHEVVEQARQLDPVRDGHQAVARLRQRDLCAVHLLASDIRELADGEGAGADEGHVDAQRALGRDRHRDVATVGPQVAAVRGAVSNGRLVAHQHGRQVIRVAEQVVAASLVAPRLRPQRAPLVTRRAEGREALLESEQMRLLRRGELGGERVQDLREGALGDVA